MLTELDGLAVQNADALPWARFCRGILAFEEARDWAAAERIFVELLATPLVPALHARLLYALGRTYIVQARWQAAIDAYGKLAAFAQRHEQPVEFIKAQRQIAATYCKGFIQGDFDKAALRQGVMHCEEALHGLETLDEAAPSSTLRWLTGSIWNTLGALHTYLEAWEDALVYYERDLAIARELDDRHGMGITLNNIAEIRHRQGGDIRTTALPAYLQALQLVQEFGNAYEEIDVRRNLGRLYVDSKAPDLARQHYEQAIDLIERLRTGVSSSDGRSGFFSTVVNTYGEMVALLLQSGATAQAFDMTERARSRTFIELLAGQNESPTTEQSIVLPDDEFGNLHDAKPLTQQAVRERLPDDTAMLAYFDTGSMLQLFVLTRDEIQIRPLALTTAQVRQAFDDSGVLQRLMPGPDGRLHKPWLLEQLYRHLVGPVAGLVTGKRRLLIVPHGALHFVPFPALSRGEQDGVPHALMDDFEIITAPSATVLLEHGRHKSPALSRRTLALGFNGARLRFAEAEAKAVANQASDHALTGERATRAGLQELAGRARWVHLSCHGHFDTAEPLASHLLLADGPLSAADILQSLKLNAELVTLSACETGRSQVLRGEELIGLVRAFHYAGTPAVVVTLWPVDEASTMLLMQRFYANLRTGQPIAAALHDAQRYLRTLSKADAMAQLARLKESASGEMTAHGSGEAHEQAIFSHPYFWAPFVLMGDRIEAVNQVAPVRE